MKTTTQKITLAIPILIIGYFIAECWYELLASKYIINWRHQVAIELFPLVVFGYFHSVKFSIWATTGFLLIGLVRGLSMTLSLSYVRIGSEGSPIEFNGLSFLLLLLFCALNCNTLADMYLERRASKFRAKEK